MGYDSKIMKDNKGFYYKHDILGFKTYIKLHDGIDNSQLDDGQRLRMKEWGF